MMTDQEQELVSRMWKELSSSPFVMLGLAGAREAHAQPMTAFFDKDSGPIYFFTSADNSLIGALVGSPRAVVTYSAKGHDLFATLHGTLQVSNDQAVIDHFWNSRIAAWFPRGRTDPSLTLLRFDPDNSEIWEASGSVGGFFSRLMGRDPRAKAEEKVAQVAL